MVWSPCRESLGAFGLLAPCERYLKERRWWEDRGFRRGIVSLCEGAGAVPVLVQALGDGDTNVRRAAAVALGAIGDASAVSVLKAVLQRERDSRVRESLRRATVALQQAARI